MNRREIIKSTLLYPLIGLFDKKEVEPHSLTDVEQLVVDIHNHDNYKMFSFVIGEQKVIGTTDRTIKGIDLGRFDNIYGPTDEPYFWRSRIDWIGPDNVLFARNIDSFTEDTKTRSKDMHDAWKVMFWDIKQYYIPEHRDEPFNYGSFPKFPETYIDGRTMIQGKPLFEDKWYTVQFEINR